MPRGRPLPLSVVLAMALVTPACGLTVAHHRADPDPPGRATRGRPIRRYRGRLTGIHRIQHVVVIMQENRSFDSYFGTYPGADGIPMQGGKPSRCVDDPRTKQCVTPFHDPSDLNHGGPHGQPAATADIDGGKMDGFIKATRQAT